MANDIAILDGAGVSKTFKTTEEASAKHVPWHKVVKVHSRVSANFTRPADTTAYGAGDAVANDTTAGSVVPLTFANAARESAGGGVITGVKVKRSNPVATNANFRLHLFGAAPTPGAGDNAANVFDDATYLGSVDLDMTSGNAVIASSGGHMKNFSATLQYACAATTLYGLLEALAAYTPASAEVITVTLALEQD